MKLFSMPVFSCFLIFNFVPYLLSGDESVSIKLEIERALGRGVKWINSEQNSSSGQWGEADYPALTALALRSTMGHPDSAVVKKYADQQAKGFSFILSKVQSDGGIYGKGLASYNTAICMMAMIWARIVFRPMFRAKK